MIIYNKCVTIIALQTVRFYMSIEINVEGLPDDRDLLIPFSAVFCGGGLRITCFEEYRATAQEYAAGFGAAPAEGDRH